MNSPILFWDVDTQLDFMDPDGSLYVHGAEDLRPNLAVLTETARRLGITIVHSTDDHDPADEEIDARAPDFVDTFPPHCLKGTSGAERVPETAAASGALDVGWDGTGFDPAAVNEAAEVILRKKRFDVFSNPATGPLLDALRPSTTVVYGVALDICDLYAVEGILGHGGIDVVVVSDAVAAVVPGRGRDLMAGWQRRGVRVASTAEVVAECEAGRPAGDAG